LIFASPTRTAFVSANTMKRIRKPVGILLMIFAFSLAAQAHPRLGAGGQANSSDAKIDLNSASEKDLETLPGVGTATAKKIISGRPYSSAADLSKAGVSASTITKITPLVTFGGGAGAGPASSPADKPTGAAKPSKTNAPDTPLDLNNASAAELKELPGVGDATAKKIIAGRPYSSVGDLSKAGVSASTIGKITPLVTIGNASVTPASARANPPVAPAARPAPLAPAPTQSTTTPSAKSPPADQGSPGKGMVWVNTDSGVYHKEGTRYYGKTKNGKYMSESDAVKAGYRAAKNE
jgi:DNA uptake protein ComE-like DNA-binding protein